MRTPWHSISWITILSCLAASVAVGADIKLVGVGPGGFYRIDQMTGECSLIGLLSKDPGLYQQPGAMAIRPSDGKILVWNNVDGGVLSYSLSTINPATGAAAVVRRYPATAIPVQALAFSPDGVLYGGASGFYRFDASGAATKITTFPNRRDGMDFGPDGRLYAFDGVNSRLDTIEPLTGAVTSSVELSVAMGYPGSIAFDRNGKLVGTGSCGRYLFDVDPATGIVSNRRVLSVEITGIGFIPEPSTLWMLICAGWFLRRR